MQDMVATLDGVVIGPFLWGLTAELADGLLDDLLDRQAIVREDLAKAVVGR